MRCPLLDAAARGTSVSGSRGASRWLRDRYCRGIPRGSAATGWGPAGWVINGLFLQSASVTGTARTAIWSQIDEQILKDAAILPGIYQKTVLYRPPNLTNAYVQAYYGMYNYAVLGVSSSGTATP